MGIDEQQDLRLACERSNREARAVRERAFRSATTVGGLTLALGALVLARLADERLTAPSIARTEAFHLRDFLEEDCDISVLRVTPVASDEPLHARARLDLVRMTDSQRDCYEGVLDRMRYEVAGCELAYQATTWASSASQAESYDVVVNCSAESAETFAGLSAEE